MERDFLGLNSVKEDIQIPSDGCKESGFQLSAFPQLVSTGFMPFSSGDFDATHKLLTAENQKFFNLDGQGGTHFSLAACPVKHELHAAHRELDVKMFPLPARETSVSINNPFFDNHTAIAGQNLNGTTTNQHLIGLGSPTTAPHTSIPSNGYSVGIVKPSFDASGSTAQLTMFYAGTVNIYDDISPEKAQAIMLLAGNGSSTASNTTHSKAQVQEPSSKLTAGDGISLNLSLITPPCSGLSSPLSVSSHTGSPPGCGSTSTNEQIATKIVDTPKVINAMESVATAMIPSPVPQARRASLARFLEKRKERVMNAAPYNFDKKSSECVNPEHRDANSCSA